MCDQFYMAYDQFLSFEFVHVLLVVPSPVLLNFDINPTQIISGPEQVQL
jgi:hypothetical protein